MPLDTARYVLILPLMFSVNEFDSFLSSYGLKNEFSISSCQLKRMAVNSSYCRIPELLNDFAIFGNLSQAVNVNIKMLEKWKIIMYVFATLLQPASLSGTVHL